MPMVRSGLSGEMVNIPDETFVRARIRKLAAKPVVGTHLALELAEQELIKAHQALEQLRAKNERLAQRQKARSARSGEDQASRELGTPLDDAKMELRIIRDANDLIARVLIPDKRVQVVFERTGNGHVSRLKFEPMPDGAQH